ncbi:hypothetical protein PIB30_092792 [Stylosanthes scabra]|uniref:Cytochrome P450 n=1 Tax=Stylosanthes scabra TaxID=79078 RepID=A0ABU6TVH4_9FABA|nr:hypothetical protein [Stylosanthes scabra]
MDSLEFIAIFAAIVSFFFIHTWWSNRNNLSINWPFFGMLPALLYNLSNIHDFATAILKHYGGTFMFKGPWLTNSNFLITSDPMNVQHITSKNFDNYIKGSDFYEIFEVLGDGIFNSDSHKWKRNRDILHSLFRKSSFESLVVKTIHNKLESCLAPLLNDVSELRTIVDLQDIFQRFSFDNICSIALGSDPNSLPNKLIEFPEVTFEKAFNKVEDVIFYRHIVPRFLWKLQKWLKIGTEKNYTESEKIVNQFLHQCISSTFQEQNKFNCTNDDDDSNFNMLKALVEESGMEKIDHKFIRDNAISLLAAGRDTISSSLCWFFWLVSTHPVVEAKILEEIRANFITKEENWLISLRLENLNKLVYLHGALCESFRLFPPIPFEHKSAVESDILPEWGSC